MFKVVHFKMGDFLQIIFRSRLFLHENNFFVKICIWISSSVEFRLYSGTTFAHCSALVMGGRKSGSISSAIGVQKCTLFIWEERRPPWPSWWEANSSGWGPRNAWKCSLWKPSPCTAGQCRYLREQLKYEKISSENEWVWVFARVASVTIWKQKWKWKFWKISFGRSFA